MMTGTRPRPRQPPPWLRDVSTLAGLAAALAMLLLLLGGVLLNLNLQRLGETRRLVRLTIDVLDRTRVFAVDIVNAETGQRGYLLTGEERYLVPYRKAIARVWSDFDGLDEVTTLPDQQARLDRLRPLVGAKLAELAQTVALRDRSYEQSLAVVRTDEGQRLTEQIRAELGAFEEAARALLAARSAQQEAAARTATYMAVGCGALAVLGAGFSAISILRRRDVRHLLEQNLRLEHEVAQRTASLEEANADLEAFAATISHDLRTPVRAIGGYAEALEEDAAARLQPGEQDFLARIGAAAERMDVLIEEILGYSRLARLDLRMAPVSLLAVVQAALDAQRETVLGTGAQIELDRDLPDVMGHAGALEAAIGNLLSNALKFTAPGTRPRIRIWAERPGPGLARLWVEDNGIGIAPSQQERIFRPFERLHGRESYAGTGVGLAIVRRVAERLAGRCGLLSSPAGSRFWMELPAARVEQAASAMQAAS